LSLASKACAGVVCSIATLCFAAFAFACAFAGNTINFRFVCQGNLAAEERESGPVL